ncbi:Uncharacterised protein [Halioglobus japonicus]|nr:Uncharacterised protein [Halioglobus japonicus]
MAKPNYSFEKRQRELAKKKKKEEKKQRKAAVSDISADDGDVSATSQASQSGTAATDVE